MRLAAVSLQCLLRLCSDSSAGSAALLR